MKHQIILKSNNGRPQFSSCFLSLKCENDNADTKILMSVKLTEWENDAYIFLPACVYDGNKFKKTYCSYPPMYEKCHLGANAEPVISDIPALNPDGSGKIEVTSGDLSVPCVGIFYKKKKQAMFIFTDQQCGKKNIGFGISRGNIEIQFPAMRGKAYRMCNSNHVSEDFGFLSKKGEEITAPVIIKEISCDSISSFFEFFFNNRRCLLSDNAADTKYSKELWSTLESHMNNDNFSGEYYAEMSKKWQCGWVGGGMSSLPLLKNGNDLSKERAIMTLDFLSSHISNKGFFYPIIENGEIKDDGFGKAHMKNAVLTRKNGDVLYFLLKHFYITEPKEKWMRSAMACADAFVKLYEEHESFGQFIDTESGKMLFGGTASGASVISALVMAYRFFHSEKYLKIAEEAGYKYYEQFIAKGITYGGPGEALCAPDSESCYAMLEAMILLYEELKDNKWLSYAKDSLYLFSSWVMPYSYRFPEGCEFAKLNINTVGSVFANAQNKHSAPGICTSSGDAIYKLYKYVNDEKILTLLRDIVLFIPQCISTDERPVYSWDKPPKKLKSGWICERVNTSDWEGQGCIGGVFNVSCWCETSALLTMSELLMNGEIGKDLLIEYRN